MYYGFWAWIFNWSLLGQPVGITTASSDKSSEMQTHGAHRPSVYRSLVSGIPDISAQTQHVPRGSGLDISITQKSETVLYTGSECCSPRIAAPWSSSENGAPRPEIDSTLDLAILEPAATLFLQDSMLMELVEVRVDVIESLLLHLDCGDPLRLDLLLLLDNDRWQRSETPASSLWF